MKKLTAILLCALLALCLTFTSVLAEPAGDAFVFTFRDGITWASTLEEAMAAEGVPEGNEYTDGNMSQFNVNGVSFAGHECQLFYLFIDGVLTGVALAPTDGSDNAKALADYQAALTEQYGQPNMTELDRVLKVVAAAGGDVGDTASFEASPWMGWALPDERTLIFVSDIDNSVGLLFLNEAPNAPALGAIPAMAENPAAHENASLRVAEGDTVVFGSYEQDGDASNGAEPIQWLVLDVQEGGTSGDSRVLLISQYELAYRPYHNSSVPVTWETSDLRAWLNGAFCSAAFTPEQRAYIERTELSTPGNYDDYYSSGEKKTANVSGGNNTQDEVFVLSYEEANRYFYFGVNSDYAAMGHRLTAPTYAALTETYAIHGFSPKWRLTKEQHAALMKALPRLRCRDGVWESLLPSLDEYAAFWKAERTLEDYAPELFWVLRTPGYEETRSCVVYDDGSISHWGEDASSEHPVRPVLWLSASALQNAAVAAKATPVLPDAQSAPLLTGTWKVDTSDQESMYYQFNEDGYHMVIATSRYGLMDSTYAIFEANDGRLRVSQLAYEGDENVTNYRVTADTLTLEGDGETLVFTRVGDLALSLAPKSMTIDLSGATPASAVEEAQKGADVPEASETAATPRGFDTEEACAKAVAEALIAGDVQAFLDCYAIPEMARGFDLAAYIEANRTLAFNNNLLLQPTSALNVAYNEATLTQRLLRRFVYSCLLLKSENPDDNSFISGLPLLPNEYTPEEMLAAADTDGALAGLAYAGIIQPDVTQDNYLRSYTRSTAYNKRIYGMAELTETVVLLEKDGRTFWLPLSLVRYDGGWLAEEFVPVVARMNGMSYYTLLVDADALEK